jgi:hypothetical protein
MPRKPAGLTSIQGNSLPCEVVRVLLVVTTQTKGVVTRYHAGNLRLNLYGRVFQFLPRNSSASNVGSSP